MLQMPVRTFAPDDEQDEEGLALHFHDSAVVADAKAKRVVTRQRLCERERLRLSGVEADLVCDPLFTQCANREK